VTAGTAALARRILQVMVTKKVDCADCRHFKRAPYEAPYTGCYHPELMVAKQKDMFLKQQELPGDHRKINLRGDCAKFEQRAKKRPFWRRLLAIEL
jgi:hypothetical protein